MHVNCNHINIPPSSPQVLFLICTVSKSVVCWQNPQYFRGSERFVPFLNSSVLILTFVNISWSKLFQLMVVLEKSPYSVFCYWISSTPWHCELFLSFVMLSFCNILYVLWVVKLFTSKGAAEISNIIIMINWFKAEWTTWKLCTFLW